MMNLSQTKLVGLTMELDLKTREYKKLCDKIRIYLCLPREIKRRKNICCFLTKDFYI